MTDVFASYPCTYFYSFFCFRFVIIILFFLVFYFCLVYNRDIVQDLQSDKSRYEYEIQEAEEALKAMKKDLKRTKDKLAGKDSLLEKYKLKLNDMEKRNQFFTRQIGGLRKKLQEAENDSKIAEAAKEGEPEAADESNDVKQDDSDKHKPARRRGLKYSDDSGTSSSSDDESLLLSSTSSDDDNAEIERLRGVVRRLQQEKADLEKRISKYQPKFTQHINMISKYKATINDAFRKLEIEKMKVVRLRAALERIKSDMAEKKGEKEEKQLDIENEKEKQKEKEEKSDGISGKGGKGKDGGKKWKYNQCEQWKKWALFVEQKTQEKREELEKSADYLAKFAMLLKAVEPGDEIFDYQECAIFNWVDTALMRQYIDALLPIAVTTNDQFDKMLTRYLHPRYSEKHFNIYKRVFDQSDIVHRISERDAPKFCNCPSCEQLNKKNKRSSKNKNNGKNGSNDKV